MVTIQHFLLVFDEGVHEVASHGAEVHGCTVALLGPRTDAIG